jgi:hypothetical protein
VWNFPRLMANEIHGVRYENGRLTFPDIHGKIAHEHGRFDGKLTFSIQPIGHGPLYTIKGETGTHEVSHEVFSAARRAMGLPTDIL